MEEISQQYVIDRIRLTLDMIEKKLKVYDVDTEDKVEWIFNAFPAVFYGDSVGRTWEQIDMVSEARELTQYQYSY